MKAAIYARFSTEKQSEASIEDQFRVCERIAERNGFKVTARFSDAAISGGTIERPGCRALLEAARRHEFDAIVAEDTSRLWRLLAEQAPRLAELSDLGVHVVTHDLDTRQESAAVLSAVVGSMAEQYRKEIGRRTRRGLEGKARAGKSAGGRSYGYIPPALSHSGALEVDAQQAEVVRQIYIWYADGWSPKTIAAELNRRGVASPGSKWRRTQRRITGWMCSGIAGDVRRAIGILNNELYRGHVVWNRTRWVRSAADSSKRRCVPNPPGEWVTRDDESLRIVDERLWDRVKARQRDRAHAIGAKVKQGVTRDRARRTGRDPKYLLSGLLKCATCGANFIMAGRDHYACASRLNGGPAACGNEAYLRRSFIQPELLAGIRRELSVPVVIAELQRRFRARMKNGTPRSDRAQFLKLEREVGNLTEAIAGGVLRTSPAIAQRLADAETALAQLKAEPVPPPPEQLLPKLAQECQEVVDRMDEAVMLADPCRGRAEIARHVGPIRVRTTPKEILLESQSGHLAATVLRTTGTEGTRQVCVVAGARFDVNNACPIRVAAVPASMRATK